MNPQPRAGNWSSSRAATGSGEIALIAKRNGGNLRQWLNLNIVLLSVISPEDGEKNIRKKGNAKSAVSNSSKGRQLLVLIVVKNADITRNAQDSLEKRVIFGEAAQLLRIIRTGNQRGDVRLKGMGINVPYAERRKALMFITEIPIVILNRTPFVI